MSPPAYTVQRWQSMFSGIFKLSCMPVQYVPQVAGTDMRGNLK
jgi:hypothetical protein